MVWMRCGCYICTHWILWKIINYELKVTFITSICWWQCCMLSIVGTERTQCVPQFIREHSVLLSSMLTHCMLTENSDTKQWCCSAMWGIIMKYCSFILWQLHFHLFLCNCCYQSSLTYLSLPPLLLHWRPNRNRKKAV